METSTATDERRVVDMQEDHKLTEFCDIGCGCRLANGTACSKQFSRDHYATMRGHAAELSWGELNMTVMGQIMALTACDSRPLNCTKHRHAEKERERSHTTYYHHGHKVCKRTFLFLHAIGDFRLKAIKNNYLAHGLVPRVHGHTGRLLSHSLTLSDVENLLKFVLQYTEANAILLPGRVPGYKRDDIQILPSTTTKKAVWLLYMETCQQLGERSLAYSTFCKVWSQFLPYVVVARPMTDLCWKCQQNSTAIVRSANLSEEEKSEVHTIISSTTIVEFLAIITT